MPSRDPAERSQIARQAARARPAGPQRTDAARQAWRAEFDAQIDPEITDPAARARIVDHAQSAFMLRRERNRQHAAALLADTDGLDFPDSA